MERIKKALEKAQAERGSATKPALRSKRRESGVIPLAKHDIEYSQTRVAEINPRHLREHRVIYGDDDREGLTAYKMLRTQVLQRMVAQAWNTLAITSPGPGDGKTLTAVNLAISLARELHHTVLLVDLDLRNPSVHKYFGLHPEYGIGDHLVDGVDVEDVLLNPSIDRLVLMPGAKVIENSSEILASPNMGQFVQELKSRYPARLVLFDLPPILATDDALSFAPHVDAFLLVLRDAKSRRDELEHAMQILKNVPIIGTVLNASDEKISTYY